MSSKHTGLSCSLSATLVLSAILSRSDAVSTAWIEPPPAGPIDDFSANQILNVGSQIDLHWFTPLPTYSIWLWQQDLNSASASLGKSVFTKSADGDEPGQTLWTIRATGFDLLSSNVFFLALGPNETLTGASTTHYFNITNDPGPATLSFGATSLTSTSTTSTTSTSASTKTSASKTVSSTSTSPPRSSAATNNTNSSTATSVSKAPSNAQVNLGIGLGVGLGVPLVLLASLLIWFRYKRRNEPAAKDNDAVPVTSGRFEGPQELQNKSLEKGSLPKWKKRPVSYQSEIIQDPVELEARN